MYRRKVQAQLTSAVPHLAMAMLWASDHPCRSVSDQWGVEESGAASALETSWSSLVLQYNTKAAHLDHGPSSWTLLDICVWNFEADSFRNGSGRFLIHLTRPKGEPCQSGRRRQEQQGFFAAMTSTWRARYRCLASATSWPGENVTFNVGQEMARASIHLPKRPHAHNKNAECHQRNLLRPINHDCFPRIRLQEGAGRKVQQSIKSTSFGRAFGPHGMSILRRIASSWRGTLTVLS